VATEAFANRLETDRYRTVLLSPPTFPTPCPPHIAQFWRLRLFEGYGTALPTRLFALPFPWGVCGIQALFHPTIDQIDWRLLGLLNVKYALVVNDGFYANAVRDVRGVAREAGPADVTIIENPNPPVPRVFFVRRLDKVPDLGAGLLALFGERIYPATRWAFRDWPECVRARLEDRIELIGPPPLALADDDVVEKSCIEGWDGPTEFPGGRITATFGSDRIEIDVDPCARSRFLVLNELWHPSWHAYADGRELPIHPTNIFMRGLEVPAGATRVVLEFRPFVTSPPAFGFYGGSLVLLLGGFVKLRRRASADSQQSADTAEADAEQRPADGEEIVEGQRR
jgi:hypothetical protein